MVLGAGGCGGVKTTVVVFPFDLFGSSGTAAGAQLLADAVREILADNKRERLPTRASAYQAHVRLKEFTFETLADYQDWRGQARQAVRQAWRKRELLVWLAGNHLGTLPVYDELAHDGEGTLVVQLDAHLDIYNLSDCTTELSHGNFLLHVAGTLPTLVNVGHRELLLRPEHIQRYYQRTFAAAELALDDGAAAVAYLQEAGRQAKRVFLDVDCDVFDPAFFPALSHPLPFGLAPPLVLRLLDAVWSERVVGVSLSEFDPGRDANDRSLATLVWLLEYLLLKRYERKR
jgi:arginase family enzyme